MIRGLLLLLPIAACQPDETVRGHGGGDRIWTLIELNGEPFEAEATLHFPDRGTLAGTAPCNSYSGEMKMPYPWFEVPAIAATKRACPNLPQETAYFAALASMTLVEVAGNTLILTNETGEEMVFKAPE